jgi:fanconi-associated nuclease 1
MFRKQMKHPLSANCGADVHSAKRLKRVESDESLYSGAPSSDDNEPSGNSLGPGDGDILLPSELGQTNLEAALPPVRTDQEAIEEFEAAQAAGALGRLGQQRWVKGKTSIYVDAFNLALEMVLKDEGHLFDEAELTIFKNWRQLNYEAQYLYVLLLSLQVNALVDHHKSPIPPKQAAWVGLILRS